MNSRRVGRIVVRAGAALAGAAGIVVASARVAHTPTRAEVDLHSPRGPESSGGAVELDVDATTGEAGTDGGERGQGVGG